MEKTALKQNINAAKTQRDNVVTANAPEVSSRISVKTAYSKNITIEEWNRLSTGVNATIQNGAVERNLSDSLVEATDALLDAYDELNDAIDAKYTKPSGGIPASDLAENYATVSDLATKADLVNGKVPTEQLPSYVDDVLEYANRTAFPSTGEQGKIYVALDTNFTYRWSGTTYIRINETDLSDYYTKTEVDSALANKQSVLTFDNTPTQNSNNPVTSDGVYKFVTNNFALKSEVDAALAEAQTVGYIEIYDMDGEESGDLTPAQAEQVKRKVCFIKYITSEGVEIYTPSHNFDESTDSQRNFGCMPGWMGSLEAGIASQFRAYSIYVYDLDTDYPSWEWYDMTKKVDEAPTQNSDNLVTSGGVHSAIATASAALDSKISKNAEDIAALTEALIKKDLYETQEATFQGITAVPAGALVKAYLAGFKGNSAVVNQVLGSSIPSWVATGGLTLTTQTTTFTLNGTTTSQITNSGWGMGDCVKGHTYFYSIKLISGSVDASNKTTTLTASGYVLRPRLAGYQYSEAMPTSAGQSFELVETASGSEARLAASFDAGVVFTNAVFQVMLIDLTAVPLTSAEMADVATAKAALKPKGMDVNSYIPYNAGTLTDSKPTKLISYGKDWKYPIAGNIVSDLVQSKTENGIIVTNNGDGSVTLTGMATAQADIIVCSWNAVSGNKYLVIGGDDSSQWGTNIWVYTNSQTIYGASIITASASQSNMQFIWRFASGYAPNKTTRPQIINLTEKFGAGNEPTTLDDPRIIALGKAIVAEYDLTMPNLKSAGNVQDSIEPNKHTKAVGQINIGSIGGTWNVNTTKKQITIATFDDTPYVANNNTKANICCPKYENSTFNQVYNGYTDKDKAISIASGGAKVWINDSGFTGTTVQEAKDYLANVPFQYALAQATDFTDLISYPEIFNVEAGGFIGIVGEGCDATAKVYFYVEA